MTAGFWKCPRCETENPASTTVCGTCSIKWEPDELVGVTHQQHLAATVTNKHLWRIASAGLDHVVIAARSREVAEAKGAQLLGQDKYDDQKIVVTAATRRGWLVYVRSQLIPFPSAIKPWQAEAGRWQQPRTPLTPRDPVEGRVYIGRVIEWFGDQGYGSIRCSDPRIGNVQARGTDLDAREQASMRAGQHVSFVIKRTSDGFAATGIMLLGLPESSG
jgi:hypothetical protein